MEWPLAWELLLRTDSADAAQDGHYRLAPAVAPSQVELVRTALKWEQVANSDCHPDGAAAAGHRWNHRPSHRQTE